MQDQLNYHLTSKVMEEIKIDNYELESDEKRTKLLELIKGGQIKKYCECNIKEDKLCKMTAEVEECYNLHLE